MLSILLGLRRTLLVSLAVGLLTVALMPLAESLDLVEFDSITLAVMMQKDPTGESVLEARLWEVGPVTLTRLGAKIGLEPLAVARGLSILASLVSLFLLQRLARRHLGPLASWLAPAVLVCTYAFWTLGLSGDNDPLPSCALLGGALLLDSCLSSLTSSRLWRALAAGALFGVAGVLHFSYLTLAAAGVLPLIAGWRRARLDGLRMCLSFGAGLIAMVLPAILLVAMSPSTAKFFDNLLAPGESIFDSLTATSSIEGDLPDRLTNLAAGGFYAFWPSSSEPGAENPWIPYGTPPPRPETLQIVLGLTMLAIATWMTFTALRRRGWLLAVPVAIVGLRVVSLIGLQGWNPERWLALLPFLALFAAILLAEKEQRARRAFLGALVLLPVAVSARAMVSVDPATSIQAEASSVRSRADRSGERTVLVLSAKTADDQRLAYELHGQLPVVLVDDRSRPALLTALGGRFSVLASESAWRELAGPGLIAEPRTIGAMPLRELRAQPADDLGVR
ncbi:MAG: hypothetical protein RL885_30760 [Planctomycetota bacterium]